jgi:hypothetical protein
MGHGLHARHQAEQNRKAPAFQREQHPAAKTIHTCQRRHEISNSQPKQKRDRHRHCDGSHAGATLTYKADFL